MNNIMLKRQLTHLYLLFANLLLKPQPTNSCALNSHLEPRPVLSSSLPLPEYLLCSAADFLVSVVPVFLSHHPSLSNLAGNSGSSAPMRLIRTIPSEYALLHSSISVDSREGRVK